MSETTYFNSRLRAGDVISDGSRGGGDANLSQTVVITGVASGNADASLLLPAGAQITSVVATKVVTQSGGTTSTVLCTAGIAAGGADYMASTDLFTTTNTQGPTTVATNLACSNIGNNTAVNLRVALNGTVTTAPQVRFTVNYAMRS